MTIPIEQIRELVEANKLVTVNEAISLGTAIEFYPVCKVPDKGVTHELGDLISATALKAVRWPRNSLNVGGARRHALTSEGNYIHIDGNGWCEIQQIIYRVVAGMPEVESVLALDELGPVPRGKGKQARLSISMCMRFGLNLVGYSLTGSASIYESLEWFIRLLRGLADVQGNAVTIEDSPSHIIIAIRKAGGSE